MTYSIVARSLDGLRWGVGVASKFLAAGAVVPGVRPPLGAIATQAFANLRFIPDGFALLDAGANAATTLDRPVSADEGRAQRQAGIVDGLGRAATFTGGECVPWAGGVTGPGYAIQGNILAGPDVVAAMEAAYLATENELRLGRRLYAALLAGDRAGGDSRGRQSAAIIVGGIGTGYGGGSDIEIDLRVDDHPDPVVELGRLLDIHALLFGKPSEIWPLDGEVAQRLRRALDRLGYDDPDLGQALERAAGIENLKERLVPGAIDPVVLQYLDELGTR